jgi:antitoxin component YwqK of YwqJK toxin-antitoxin module|tara:strand:- start:56 stop:274 length:219 start_codon:yes stop_codon:yes gene_type:complete
MGPQELLLGEVGYTIGREYYDNGKLKSEGHFKNGKQEGLSTGWHKNGVRKEWDYNGKLIFEGNFVDGVEEIK